jgi:hypothetical protein
MIANASAIPDGRKTGVQQIAQIPYGIADFLIRVHAVQRFMIDAPHPDMDVLIDEPGHDCAVLDLDHFGILGDIELILPAHELDPVSAYGDDPFLDRSSAVPIDHPTLKNCELFHFRSPILLKS